MSVSSQFPHAPLNHRFEQDWLAPFLQIKDSESTIQPDSWYPIVVLVFGLTGGIASGKSTVSKLLKAFGVEIVDADLLAREAVALGSPALEEIAQQLGAQFIGDDGCLLRKELGSHIFTNSESRSILNGILHPIIAKAGTRALAALKTRGLPFAIYEAPLLVENNLHHSMDGLIVVSIPAPLQIQRLQDRDQIDEEAAKARLASQLPLAQKLEFADYVIDNSGTRSETKVQVAALLEKLQAR